MSEGEGRGAMRESRAFEFLRMNQRQLKPRTVGLTKIATALRKQFEIRPHLGGRGELVE